MRSLYRHSIYTLIGHENLPYSAVEKKNIRQPKVIWKPGLLVLFCLCCLICCNIDDDMQGCKGNVRIQYRYMREDTDTKNVLPNYIRNIREYIFDERGILYQINTLPGNSSFGKFVSEFNLPQGKYIAVAWGNMENKSTTNEISIGSTNIHEMIMYLNNPTKKTQNTSNDMQGNSEPLYYGYRTFSVKEQGASRIAMDMSHMNCLMRITVTWKSAFPKNTDNFYMQLKQIPGNYSFTPEFLFRNNALEKFNYDKELFLAESFEKLSYLTNISNSNNLVTHRIKAKKSINTIQGEFVTYRYRNDSHPLLSIYVGDRQETKDIDLYKFFRTMNINLNTNQRQEFDLLVEIDGDKITVGLVSVGDWNDGGSL